jgi:hypothetical protein
VTGLAGQLDWACTAQTLAAAVAAANFKTPRRSNKALDEVMVVSFGVMDANEWPELEIQMFNAV